MRCSVCNQAIEITRADRIETGRWFIEKHDLRIERESAGQCHSLGHAAGQFRWKFFQDACIESNHLELGDDQLIEQFLRQLEIFADRKLKIFPHRQR